ncbi:hypothetical protein Hanom_Chr13g01216101 [Helianthus anomalus]
MISSLGRPFITNICQLGVRMQFCDEKLVESTLENAEIKKRKKIAKKLAIVIFWSNEVLFSIYIG